MWFSLSNFTLNLFGLFSSWYSELGLDSSSHLYLVWISCHCSLNIKMRVESSSACPSITIMGTVVTCVISCNSLSTREVDPPLSRAPSVMLLVPFYSQAPPSSFLVVDGLNRTLVLGRFWSQGCIAPIYSWQMSYTTFGSNNTFGKEYLISYTEFQEYLELKAAK